MSTRSVIARRTPTGFAGRYHHWDGYPSALGAALHELGQPAGPFAGDVEKMLTTLIDEHPAGWSTIVGTNWNFVPGMVDLDHVRELPCAACGQLGWRHYAQHYAEHGEPTPASVVANGITSYAALGHPHEPVADQEMSRPQCYCHGDRAEAGWEVTEANAASSGCEYAYLLDAEMRTITVLSSVTPTGRKMVGAFGMGSPMARWQRIGEVSLDDPNPAWDVIELTAADDFAPLADDAADFSDFTLADESDTSAAIPAPAFAPTGPGTCASCGRALNGEIVAIHGLRYGPDCARLARKGTGGSLVIGSARLARCP